MKKYLKEYRVELIALALALLGIFLLVEQFEIRGSIREIFARLVDSGTAFWESTKTLASEQIASFTVSDFLGWVLLLGALIFIIWRVRYHFLRSGYWRIKNCPKCDSELERIHRTRFQRLLAKTILPHARRYRCTNNTCNWTGLRHRLHYRHPSQVYDEQDAEGLAHFLTHNQGDRNVNQ